jgi:hypothetical protein
MDNGVYNICGSKIYGNNNKGQEGENDNMVPEAS